MFSISIYHLDFGTSVAMAYNVWIGATTVGEVISLVARETAINKDKTHTRTAIQCMGFEKSVKSLSFNGD